MMHLHIGSDCEYSAFCKQLLPSPNTGSFQPPSRSTQEFPSPPPQVPEISVVKKCPCSAEGWRTVAQLLIVSVDCSLQQSLTSAACDGLSLAIPIDKCDINTVEV